MIAQSLSQRQYGTNNIKPLAAYVLRVAPGPAQDKPLHWGLQTDRSTEAVAWAKAVNCASDHLGWAITDMDYTQQMNKIAHTSKSYHYVVSFPAGEQPSRDVLENIESVLSSAIGYREHQRLMAVHRDTPYLHMHVVVNRIHPDSFRCVGSSFDHLVLQRVAAELEVTHNLTPTNHINGTRDYDRMRPPYQPTWQAIQPGPVLSPELLAQFTIQKQEAYRARKDALDKLRQQHLAYLHKLNAWHQQRRRNAAVQHLSRADRASTSIHLQEAFKHDHENRKQKEKQEREAVRQQFLIPTMEAFKAQAIDSAARTMRLQREEHAHLHFPDRTKRGPVTSRDDPDGLSRT